MGQKRGLMGLKTLFWAIKKIQSTQKVFFLEFEKAVVLNPLLKNLVPRGTSSVGYYPKKIEQTIANSSKDVYLRSFSLEVAVRVPTGELRTRLFNAFYSNTFLKFSSYAR